MNEFENCKDECVIIRGKAVWPNREIAKRHVEQFDHFRVIRWLDAEDSSSFFEYRY